MVADGYNLSCPQSGIISNSGHGEDWSWGDVQTGSMMFGCLSCNNHDRSKQNGFEKPTKKITVDIPCSAEEKHLCVVRFTLKLETF